MTKTKRNIDKFLIWFVSLTLLAAFTYNFLRPDTDFEPMLKESLPNASTFKQISSGPATYEGFNEGGEKVGYVVIEQANAYGGPLTMITGINLEGDIAGAFIADHNDTPTFIHIVKNNKLLEQFIGKKISDPLIIDNDINRVSGATFTSSGVANAISLGSHAVANNIFNLNVVEEEQPINFGVREIIMLSLLLLVIVGITFKIQKLRWLTLIGGLVFIGFVFNTSVSLGSIAGISMGYFPVFKQNVLWYIFFIGVPLTIIVLGKNIYCYWMCPFGAVQELTSKVGGGKLRCKDKGLDNNARKIRYGLTYIALLAALIIGAPGFAGYEPFATLFALEGSGIKWFILPIVLFTSLFVHRFWCNYFCPVGVINDLLVSLTCTVKKLFKGVTLWNNKKKTPNTAA